MVPLNGTRVVTIALNAPGPVAAAKLRDAGATVTKVEPPSGDPLEHYCPAWYADLHSGVEVRRVNLKSEEGRAQMNGLLEGATVFLSSQRPGALARLALDRANLPSHIRSLNIVGELSQPEIAGHDLTYLAKAGLLGAELPRTLIADILGAEHVFSAVLLLLQSPAGSHTEIGLYDSLKPLVAPLQYGLTGPGTMLGGGLPGYGIYETREGRIAVAALESHFQSRLYAELELPPGSKLAAAFRTQTAAEWEAWGRERDLPISAVRDETTQR